MEMHTPNIPIDIYIYKLETTWFSINFKSNLNMLMQYIIKKQIAHTVNVM